MALIRVYDETSNVIETHEHLGDFKEPPPRSPRKSATYKSGRGDEGTAPDCLSHARRSRDRLSESLDAAASV